MIRIGRGIGRKAVQEAVERGDAATVVYDDVLEEHDIRETFFGVKDAGMPRAAVALLTWLASHPNSPEDVLRGLFRHGTRAVLVGLAMNRKLPEDLWRLLLEHQDEDVREHAHNTFSRMKKH